MDVLAQKSCMLCARIFEKLCQFLNNCVIFSTTTFMSTTDFMTTTSDSTEASGATETSTESFTATTEASGATETSTETFTETTETFTETTEMSTEITETSTEVTTPAVTTPNPRGEPGRVYVGVASVIVDSETSSDLMNGLNRTTSTNIRNLEDDFDRYVSTKFSSSLLLFFHDS